MLARLKLDARHDGFLFLAEHRRGLPWLRSHRHAELELNLVVSGSISYLIDGQRLTLRPRHLLWLFPSQNHQLVDRSDDAAYWVAVFTPAMIRQTCSGSVYAELAGEGIAGTAIQHRQIAPAACDLLTRVMHSIAAEGPDPGILNREGGYGVSSAFTYRHSNPELLNAGLRYLLLSAWNAHRASDRTPAGVALHPAVRRAVALLDQDERPLSLHQLAQHCASTPTYLSRLLRRDLGVPLSQYRNALRLGRFWQRHQRGDGLLEAALAAGFGSYAQFYKTFARTYGQSPRRYLSANASKYATGAAKMIASSRSR